MPIISFYLSHGGSLDAELPAGGFPLAVCEVVEKSEIRDPIGS